MTKITVEGFGKVKWDHAELKAIFEGEPEVTVVFEKADKSMRTMRCTTELVMIPTEFHPKGTSKAKPNLDVFNVWDLDANGWRSFRIENLRKLSI